MYGDVFGGSGIDRMPEKSTWVSNSRWIALAFAFTATVINYLDRQSLSVLAPVLLQKLHISSIGYGNIIAAFMLAYTVMNGVSGPLLDRLGLKVGYALTLALWSGAELLQILSRGAISLGIFRFVLGAGEAGNYPAGVKLVREWFPAKERSLASGIFNAGASVGSILAPPLLAWAALTMGWKAGFGLVGALGFIWLAAWLLFYRPPLHRVDETRRPPPSVSSLVRNRFVWQFTVSKIFSDPVWYFYIFWFPQYLKVGRGFTLQQIGEKAMIPFITGGIGNFAGGLVCQGFMALGVSAQMARRVSVLLFSACMGAAAWAAMVNSANLSIALVSLATFGYCGALANLLALPGDLFPENAVASIWGLASMGSGFGGMLFSQMTGILVYHYSFRPVFIVFGIIPILSAVIVWFLPRGEQMLPAHS
jgi:ACS family hexuronate transporter-like MFS transporter